MKVACRSVAVRGALFIFLLCFVALVCSCSATCPESSLSKSEPIKVVVVTGGHGFEHDAFFLVFQGYDDITHVEAAQKDHSELFEDISDWNYDVIVLYNMSQKISAKRQANFKKLLDKGVGLVALHHAVGAFQEWDDYRKIIGSKFCLKDTQIDGVPQPQGTYEHDIDVPVHIADAKHPITKGMSDFEIHDEIYGKCWYDNNSRVLLTTDQPGSNKIIAQTKKYGKARVCFIQLGHDSKAYMNPNFRRFVANAIRWSAQRLK